VSASVEDEARARLDVAQLYEDMGQMPKAVRYFLEAAQIYRTGGLVAKAKDLLQKVLEIEPGNAAAELEMKRLSSGQTQAAVAANEAAEAAASRPAAAPAPAGAAPPRPRPANALPQLQLPQPQAGKVLVPTPWLFRDPRYVAAAKKQLLAPVDRNVLTYDPLPKVDAQMVMTKQEQRKKAEAEAARKANPRVESAFGNRPSPFAAAPGGTAAGATPAGGLFGQAKASGPAAPAPTPAPGAAAQAPRPGLGGGRAGNLELAEQIRRRMQEKGK
jgi:tetratricopeptide (TPR) repeat protein